MSEGDIKIKKIIVDFDNPATTSIVPKLETKGTTTNPYGGNTVAASYKPRGRFISEQATGGGTITAHTDAGDVTITIPTRPPPPKSDTFRNADNSTRGSSN